MLYRSALPRGLLRTSAVVLACWAGAWSSAQAAPKTVCTVTINSSDEKEALQRHLPAGDYRIVELVQKGHPDWYARACKSGITCDALVISGHFDDGTEFYTDRFDDREFLAVTEMQQASCGNSCGGLFSQLKEVYLFGCNTLKAEPRYVASEEIRRALVREGSTPADAERQATQLSERYGQSNRDRIRHIFKNVPVIYGFASKAPLGRYAGPLMERYFQTAPAGEFASGKPSATMLSLFGPTSMVALPGLTDADPHASFRQDMCAFASDVPSDAQKVASLHQFLQRDITDVRMFLEHLERYTAALTPAQRRAPEVAAGLRAIAADDAARERFMAFARDADRATVQVRMMALARSLGWLTAEKEETEFLDMVARRMAQDRLGKHEVDLVCSTHPTPEPRLAQRLVASGAPQASRVAHSAVLACLGSPEAHERTLRALTSSQDEEVEVAQVYLRHRPLADVDEVRAIAAGIGRMTAPSAQTRALETLARQRLADPQSLQAIAGLFPRARSLAVQRAIANILVRSDYKLLGRADLARSLRQHRLKSPDGQDVIDVLIRLLQTA